MVSVLITIPHATCGSLIGHSCDYSAKYLADEIEQEFQKVGINDVKKYEAKIPRSEIDMNRKESRNTKFREEIIEDIKSKKGKKIWVLDIHSFPDNDFHTDSDFVILDTRDGNYHKATSYVKKFVEYTKKNNLSVVDLPGADSWNEETNDIMDTSREKGAFSFLIEAKEGLKSNIVRKMAECIVNFIKNNN